jgi:ABC-type Zn uptake system ZnuABC Zn-binding protein ZnuA
MKMLAEYLDTAMKFERMAAVENDPKLKAEFEKQAAAYRKLVEKRATEYGLKTPPAQ